MLHVACVDATETSRDDQHVCDTCHRVKTPWFLLKEFQQSLVLQGHFCALARAMTEGANPCLGNESSGGVMFAGFVPCFLRSAVAAVVGLNLCRRGCLRMMPCIEVLNSSRAAVVASLLVSSDVPLFVFPVTHVFFTCFAFPLHRTALLRTRARRFRN